MWYQNINHILRFSLDTGRKKIKNSAVRSSYQLDTYGSARGFARAKIDLIRSLPQTISRLSIPKVTAIA